MTKCKCKEGVWENWRSCTPPVWPSCCTYNSRVIKTRHVLGFHLFICVGALTTCVSEGHVWAFTFFAFCCQIAWYPVFCVLFTTTTPCRNLFMLLKKLLYMQIPEHMAHINAWYEFLPQPVCSEHYEVSSLRVAVKFWPPNARSVALHFGSTLWSHIPVALWKYCCLANFCLNQARLPS